jgi:2,4-dienoyl-CoA reductase (NADPH2)
VTLVEAAAELAQRIAEGEFDEVVLATGVLPRQPEFEGLYDPKVLSYDDVFAHGTPVGNKVAIICASSIGYDVAEFLFSNPDSE